MSASMDCLTSDAALRLGPTNPLLPHIGPMSRGSMPFQPALLTAASQTNAQRRKVRKASTRLAIDRVSSAGASHSTAQLSTPTRTRSNRSNRGGAPAAAAGKGNGKKGSARGGHDSDGWSAELRALSKLRLSVAELRRVAATFEADAVREEESILGTTEHLPIVLGQQLMQEMETMGSKEHAQEFFRKLDLNGDGFVSHIEFKQMMRKLGFLGDASK